MYRVRAVLGVPGVASVLTALDFDSLEGDSVVELPPGVTSVALPLGPAPANPELSVWVLPNRFGRAASAELQFVADSFDSARKLSYDVLAPMMSRLSFDHDVALDIVATEITEVATASCWRQPWQGAARAGCLRRSTYARPRSAAPSCLPTAKA